jgi:hypothetical protein
VFNGELQWKEKSFELWGYNIFVESIWWMEGKLILGTIHSIPSLVKIVN